MYEIINDEAINRMLNKSVYESKQFHSLLNMDGISVIGPGEAELSRAKGISALGKYLGDNHLLSIAEKQIGWVLGDNPFCRSYMYGEGYDYQPMFCQFTPNIVGAVPVGIKVYEDDDIPYMPATSGATYYEIWVHPASRMLWTICDLL